MRFVDGHFQQVQRKELIDLEDLATEFLFALHRFAHLFRRSDDDVVAGGSRAERIVPGADAANRPARHPDSRPVNYPQIGALFLRQGPWAILVELDIGAGRNSQMEIKLSMEILQVAMTIDEARQNGLALNVDDLAAGRNCNLTAYTDRLQSVRQNFQAAAGRCHRSVFHPAPRVLSLPCFPFLPGLDHQTAGHRGPTAMRSQTYIWSGYSRPPPASMCFTI